MYHKPAKRSTRCGCDSWGERSVRSHPCMSCRGRRSSSAGTATALECLANTRRPLLWLDEICCGATRECGWLSLASVLALSCATARPSSRLGWLGLVCWVSNVMTNCRTRMSRVSLLLIVCGGLVANSKSDFEQPGKTNLSIFILIFFPVKDYCCLVALRVR